jgi:hypothetical protein
MRGGVLSAATTSQYARSATSSRPPPSR